MEQPQRSTYQDDEISLVDLAKILIRRRWWLIGTAGVVVLLALAFALLTHGDPEYQYTSIYQQAEAEPGRPLTSSASVIQQMESLDWPNYQRRYKEENKVEALPFDLEINNPDNTTLVTLNSTATAQNRDQVLNLHETLLGSVIERQQEALERENYADRLFELERELENLKEGEVIEYAARGEEQEGTSSMLILVLGIVLGGIAGVMAAFFAEFVFRVRESLAAEKEA